MKNILTGPGKIGDPESAEGVQAQRMEGTQEKGGAKYFFM